jgi:DNA-binding XRE family transcriptional regulator
MDNNRAIELGKYLSWRRRKLNLDSGQDYTQTDIAVRVGIPQGTYNKFETGRVLPSDRNKHKLAAFWGLDVYEICGGPIMMPDNPILRQIAKAWARLPEDAQKKYGDAILKAVAEWEAREPSYQPTLVVE